MRTLELMPLLAEKGVKFDFCTLSSDMSEGILDKRIRSLGGEIYPCAIRPGVVGFVPRFIKLIKQIDCDIIHSHIHYASGFIVWLAKVAGVKSRIIHFRSAADGKPDIFTRKVYRKMMRLLLDRYATDILAVCRGAMEFGWGENWQADSRCKVIYNGFNLSAFNKELVDRQGVREEFGIPVQNKLFINVGRFSVPKAHDILLEAASDFLSHNTGIDFLLVGDGVLREKMEVLTKRLGISERIHFVGTRNDVPRLLKASDCFVLSSRREGLPGVVLEAIAAGLPVIATDLPGVREIAEHTEAIRIVPVENSKALTMALDNMANSNHFHREPNQIFPNQFDLKTCAFKTLEVYEQRR